MIWVTPTARSDDFQMSDFGLLLASSTTLSGQRPEGAMINCRR